MTKKMVNLEITFKLDGVTPGEDQDNLNPLARALANLLQTGQSFQRLVQCFVLDNRDQSSKNDLRIRWFGVFVYSDGNRVIFFPGFEEPMTEVHMVHHAEPEISQSFQFDHFTLEPDLQKWHITNADSSDHISRPGFRTQSLGEDRYHWFGLSIASLDVLRIARETKTISSQVPDSDAERRMQVFLNARENAIFEILEFHPEITMSDTHSAHFSIIVGKGSSKLYEGNQLGLPYGSPYLSESLNGKKISYPTRRHQIGLSINRDLQIDTVALPSELTYPIVVTSSSD